MRPEGSLIGDLFNMEVLFGILIGIAAPFLVWVTMQPNAIKEYQDLISGIMALFGAAIAVGAVTHQIRHAQKLEDDRRYRQRYAARAMAPHALTSLCDYAERCCASLRALLGTNPPPDKGDAVPLPDNFKLPDLPETSMEPLQQLLQFGDREIQYALSTLMQCLQVQQSRIKIRDAEINQTIGYQYYGRIAEAIEVYARAAALFDYARDVTERVAAEPSKDHMNSAAAHGCGFWHPKWDPVRTFIDKNWQPYKPKSFQ